jgi:5-methylcytosine-specific restriction endonuclease McrA
MVRQAMVDESNAKNRAINSALSNLVSQYGGNQRELTPEEQRESAARWNKAIRQYSRSRARQVRPDILARCKGCCEVCGDFQPWTLQVHHIIPVRKKGEGTPGNLTALCPNCHAVLEVLLKKKGEMTEFYAWMATKYTAEQLDKLDGFLPKEG